MQRGNAVRELRADLNRSQRGSQADGEERVGLLGNDEGASSAARLRRAGLVALWAGRGTRASSEGNAPSFLEQSFILGTGVALRPTNGTQAGPRNAYWSPRSDITALAGLLLSSWMNVLLVLVPLGVVAARLEWNATAVFCLNFFGIIPLALILGDVTEDLALRCGDVIGGLVNATFGNVVELILSCVALSKHKPELNAVAGLSNLGSVLSNLLLVLGCCFFFGGMRYRVQTFNAIANQVCNSLLFLAVVALTLPCAAAYLPDTRFSEADMLAFSRIIAVLLLAVYLVYLYFQLISHNSLFQASTEPAIATDGSEVPNGGPAAAGGEGEGEEEEEGKTEEPALTVTAELLTLLAISVIVAGASECITDSIHDMAASSGLTTDFLSVVLLPLAGNAVEHITAVMVALKNKMDLALGIAIGSSLQIALFVLPICVLASWAMGNDFTLNLDGMGTIALAVAIIHANFITQGAKSHYLMGLQLICTYFLISAAFLFTGGTKGAF